MEIPNKPYQRNVLREMSLSQTSPIGINKQPNQENKVAVMAKDLEKSLNQENIEEAAIEEKIKEDLQKIESLSQRTTEIIDDTTKEENIHMEESKQVEKINITEEILNRYKREKKLKHEQELKRKEELKKEEEMKREERVKIEQEKTYPHRDRFSIKIKATFMYRGSLTVPRPTQSSPAEPDLPGS